MTAIEKKTEDVIFDAAQDVFIQKGYEGTRMEEIAKVAGINKSLLHYYYRTKDKLFNAIFEKAFRTYILPKIQIVLDSDVSIFTKIEMFTEVYIDTIMKNPYIPNFIINELNRNPDNVTELFNKVVGQQGNDFLGKLKAIIDDEVKRGTIRPIAAEHLIINVVSMCIFPFVARPIVQGVILKGDKKAFAQFIEERKKEVADFVIRSIRIENTSK
jgi:TetR/AcrR family transcriptional regulator